MPLTMTTINRTPTQTPGEVLVVFTDVDVATPDGQPFVQNVLLRAGDVPGYDAETTPDSVLEAAARTKLGGAS